MTINKYLQNKVDINEILESDRDFILRQIDQIENKETPLFSEKEKYCIYRILSIYYIDYLNSGETIWRTTANIYNDIDGFDNNDTIKDINKVLELLVSKNILKVEKRNEGNTQFYFENYNFSDAVINSLKAIVSNDNENIEDSNCEYECNNKSYDCKNCQSEEDIKKIEIIRAENIFMIYNNYHGEAINQIETTLKSVFGFEITNNDNLLNFKIGGAKSDSDTCGYNLYLSRGYIVFEAEDNSTIDNVYTLDNVAELVDLIKDIKEDN